MCYYNGVKIIREEVSLFADDYKLIEGFDRDLQSGFDYEKYPIAFAGSSGVTCELAHWEFIPFWYRTMKDVAEARKKYTTLNAQGEKLLDSKIYAEAGRERRCIVFSSGFYEWRHYKNIAYPYHIKVEGKGLFPMAGVRQPWTDKETGETFDTFAVITTEADKLMTQVHNKKRRMPTILTEETAALWLSDTLSEPEIKELATFHTPEILEAYTIRKDFRSALDPKEAFNYEGLPPLQVV